MGIFDKLFGGGNHGAGSHGDAGHGNEEHHATTEHNGPHGDLMRWDAETNQPKGFILGASPGFASFAPVEGGQRLSEKGLARKVMKGSRMGFDFVQIDFETISEINEQELKQLMDHVRSTQQVEIGIHAPVTGQNALDLGIAYTPFWDRHHRNLQRTAYAAAEKCGAKYILAHTSHTERPRVTFFVGSQEYRLPTVSHDGINLAEFIERVDSGKYEDPKNGKIMLGTKTPDGRDFKNFKDWFKAKFISVLFHAMGVPGDPGLIAFFDEWMLVKGKAGFETGEKEIQDKFFAYRKKLHGMIDKELDAVRNSLISEINKVGAPHGYDYSQGRSPKVALPPDVSAAIAQLLTQLESLSDPAKSAQIRENIENNLKQQKPELRAEEREVQGAYVYIHNYNFNKVFDYWSRHGSEAEESIAYKIIAKYMYLTKDPLWKELVGDSPKLDPDLIIWAADRGKTNFGMFKLVKGEDGKDKEVYQEMPDVTKKDIVHLVYDMITAVACKYIQGHVLTKEGKWQMGTLPEQWITNEDDKKLSIYDYLKKHKLQMYFETEQPGEGLEGRLRVMTGLHHIALVKNIDDGKLTAVTLDFEHLSTNLIDPIEDIKTYPEGSGKYLRMTHCNGPRPYPGEHAPLYIHSRDMLILYKWFWKLHEKGMHNAYIIWEMGSYGVQQSAIALRSIIQHLMKGIAPDKLPPEFYGLDQTFEARQFVAVREHAWDPLEGMVAHNEETWTMLGEQAKAKGKLQEWLKSKYR